MNTQMKTSTRKTRFSHIALALSLSLGTVGGMMGFVALTEPAFAAAAGGGNGGGGGGANGGEGGNVMAIAKPVAAVNNAAPALHGAPNGCTTARNTPERQNCHYTERGTPRIVNIHGFANCAVIGQRPGSNGRGEFYCLRPM